MLCSHLAHKPHFGTNLPFPMLLYSARHEDVSLAIVRYLCATAYSHDPKLAATESQSVQEMISPLPSRSGGPFAFINNLDSGLDVDKFDYLVRDLFYHKLGNESTAV